MGKRSPVPEFLSDDEWQEHQQLDEKKGNRDPRILVACLQSCRADLAVFEDELKDPSRLPKKTRKGYENIRKRILKDIRELEGDLAKAGPPILTEAEYARFDELNKRYWEGIFAPPSPEEEARLKRRDTVLKYIVLGLGLALITLLSMLAVLVILFQVA